MAFDLSVNVRNAQLDAYESTIGAAPLLFFYTGSKPANCSAAASGTLIAVGTLPSDWMAAASGGSKSKSGTWTVTGNTNAGAGTNAGYYRIYDNSGTTCHEQGSITASGGGGDMELDNISIANGQNVTVNTFTRTMGNAGS